MKHTIQYFLSKKYVDLSERVTVPYFNEEFGEWMEKTVTIEDVLNKTCNDYTVLTSTEPKRKTGKWIPINTQVGELMMYAHKCSECGRMIPASVLIPESEYRYCQRCGAEMEI